MFSLVRDTNCYDVYRTPKFVFWFQMRNPESLHQPLHCPWREPSLSRCLAKARTGYARPMLTMLFLDSNPSVRASPIGPQPDRLYSTMSLVSPLTYAKPCQSPYGCAYNGLPGDVTPALLHEHTRSFLFHEVSKSRMAKSNARA